MSKKKKVPTKTYEFRAYLTKSQEKKLDEVLELCRVLYNTAIWQRRDFYRKNKRGLNYVIQANQLKDWKEELPEYKQIHSQVLQDVLKRLEHAYSLFFKKVELLRELKKNGKKVKHIHIGLPRFKSKFRYKSITYPQSGFKIDKNKMFLSKIGHIKFVQHRDIIGKIKTCSLIRKPTGKYFLSITTEIETSKTKIDINNDKNLKEVGLDVGVKNYITTSNGETFDNPKFIKKHEQKLNKAISRRDKKPKGSEIRKRHSKHVARLNEKITNCRKDFQHKLSKKLVEEYDIFYMEHLDIISMLENDNKKNLHKHIEDCSWSRFRDMISYKAGNAGKKVILVDPKNTSQMCSRCGAIIPKELSQRMHICDHCGLKMDRDHNAAINIFNRGKAELFPGRVGTNSPIPSRSSLL